MADDTSTTPPADNGGQNNQQQQNEPPATGGDQPLGEAGERALAQEREARKAAERDLKALRRELEGLKHSSMTEAERAVAEAEARGRSTAVAEYGRKLAQREFDVLAARRNPDADTAPIFEYLDLSRFVGEDGEPDSKAIAAAVERLVPAPNGTRPPSFDGGQRIPAASGDSMTALIRRAAGRG